MNSWEKRFYVLAFTSLFIILELGAFLQKQTALLKQERQQFASQYSTLYQGFSLIQEKTRKLHDDPVYGWPIAEEDFDRISSVFGYRLLLNPFTGGSKSSNHKGVDLVGTHHARVIAVSDGVVIENYPPPNGFFKGHPLLGGMIKIKHTDGTYSVYGHLSASYVSEYGSKRFVKRGQVIGRTGDTGQSYGEHLHFELHDKNDVSIQPLFYIDNPLIQ